MTCWSCSEAEAEAGGDEEEVVVVEGKFRREEVGEDERVREVDSSERGGREVKFRNGLVGEKVVEGDVAGVP